MRKMAPYEKPILLTNLLTTALDGHGRGWSHSRTTRPASRSNRHPWIAQDVPDLATDQKGTQLRGGAAAPDPAAYALSPPLFQPLTAYAARGRILPAPARGNPAP